MTRGAGVARSHAHSLHSEQEGRLYVAECTLGLLYIDDTLLVIQKHGLNESGICYVLNWYTGANFKTP